MHSCRALTGLLEESKNQSAPAVAFYAHLLATNTCPVSPLLQSLFLFNVAMRYGRSAIQTLQPQFFIYTVNCASLGRNLAVGSTELSHDRDLFCVVSRGNAAAALDEKGQCVRHVGSLTFRWFLSSVKSSCWAVSPGAELVRQTHSHHLPEGVQTHLPCGQGSRTRGWGRG